MDRPIYPKDPEYPQAMLEAKAEYLAWEMRRTNVGKSITVFTRKDIDTNDESGYIEGASEDEGGLFD